MGKVEISITIDEDLHNGTSDFPTFVPGQRVSGKVHLALHRQKNVDCVVIDFDGTCFTQITRRSGNQNRRYQEEIPLFHFSQKLFEGPYKMQATTLDWPFSFTFPQSTNYVRQGRGLDLSQYISGPQPLPPSLDVDVQGMRAMQAKVFYSLTARINPQSFIGGKDSILPLVLMPYSPNPLPRPEPVPVQVGHQSWSSSSLRPEKHSFKQKMGHVFSNDPSLKTPSINFHATSYLPGFASIWQPFVPAISIQYRQHAPTDPVSPTLVLEVVVLAIKQHTGVRVKSVLGTYDDAGKQLIATKEFTPGVTLPHDGQLVQVSETFKLADMLREVYRLTPSFKTYTINQSYQLKMTATVLHPETGHRFKLEAKTPFVIHPIENPNPPSFSVELHGMAPKYVVDGSDTLPVYEGPSGSSTQHSLQSNQQDYIKRDEKNSEGNMPY